MHRPMTGVRVLEVAQYTFVPSAGAVLGDWGADVIKIEHPVTGDAQRGLVSVLGLDASVPGSTFHPIMEGPNRGKRSVGLALDNAAGRTVLEDLIRRSDVFLTNYLPGVRKKLAIDVDDVRQINPDIVYVSGSGQGSEGPDADKGAYDTTAFWARGGSCDGTTALHADAPALMPAGAYGDNIGGLAVAGAVAAALYGRQSTGEPSVIDVSLLAVGAWAMQFNVNLALLQGGRLPKSASKTQVASNPLTGAYRTADGKLVSLSMLQPTRYWPLFCSAMGLHDAATDDRFGSMESMAVHADAAQTLVREAIAARTFDECKVLLDRTTGQWAPIQDAWDVGHDESLIANGRIVDVVDAQGQRRKLVANPAKFDDDPLALTRAPQFAEHTDEVLRELGVDDDALIELKIAGAIT